MSAIVTGTVGLMSLKELGTNAAAIAAVLTLLGIVWRWKPVRDTWDRINRHRDEDRRDNLRALLEPYFTPLTEQLSHTLDAAEETRTIVNRELRPNGRPVVDKIDDIRTDLALVAQRVAALEQQRSHP